MGHYTVVIAEHPFGINFSATLLENNQYTITLHEVLGLRLGDELVAINGTAVSQMSILEISKALRREQIPLNLTLMREEEREGDAATTQDLRSLPPQRPRGRPLKSAPARPRFQSDFVRRMVKALFSNESEKNRATVSKSRGRGRRASRPLSLSSGSGEMKRYRKREMNWKGMGLCSSESDAADIAEAHCHCD